MVYFTDACTECKVPGAGDIIGKLILRENQMIVWCDVPYSMSWMLSSATRD